MIIIQFQMLINHLFQNWEPNNDLNYVGSGVYSGCCRVQYLQFHRVSNDKHRRLTTKNGPSDQKQSFYIF